MVVPVIGRIERHRHKPDAIPLGAGNQAPTGFFGKAGFHPDTPLISGKQPVMVAEGVFHVRLYKLNLHAFLGSDLSEPLVLHSASPQQSHIISCRIVIFVVQSGGCDKIGVFHADLLRPLVHQLGKFLCGTGDRDGRRVGGVVAGAQKHPLGQRRKGYHIPRLQAHRGALHPDHFIGDLHLTVLCLSRFQGQKRRHNFSRAGHRQLFLRGFLVQHRTVVRSHQNRRLSGNGRLSAVGRRRRSRAGKDSSCSQQSA